MKRTLSQRLLLACLLTSLTSVAAAQTVVTASKASVDLRAEDAASDADSHSFCLRETGTRIKQAKATTTRAGDCATSSPGRSYSRRDIERTGEFELSDALRKLDPSIH